MNIMQFDWMVACYPGDGVHREYPIFPHETCLELFGDEVMPQFT